MAGSALAGFDHRPGAHCGSTSLRNLADYYGWGFDEAACFGLASGLGFAYFELPRSPWRMFIGRPLWLERAFFEHLDVAHTDTRGEDWETAWRTVRERLDGGDPVMVFVDLYYLDYYGTDTHFAPHSLLVVGYDGDAALMADSEFEVVQDLPLRSLRAAWSADDVMPLQNRYLAVDDPSLGTDPSEAAGEAIRETAAYMLDPASANRETVGVGEHGVPGIRAFAADLPAWADLEDADWTIRFAYQNVERRGTGGGAFRRLYADFLGQFAEDVGLDAGAADRMAAIADDWTALSEVLKEASETDDAGERAAMLDRASSDAAAIADREEAFFEDVLAQVG